MGDYSTPAMIRRLRRLELARAIIGDRHGQWRAQVFIEALEDLLSLEVPR